MAVEYNSYARYEGDGQTTDFTVPFGYLDKNHVRAKVNGVPTFVTWPDDHTISFPNGAPKEGTIIELRRQTPVEKRQVNFSDGSRFRADDLNADSRQLLYLVQEIRDGFYGGLAGDDPDGVVGDGTDPESIVGEVTEKVSESDLYDQLQQSIDEIEGIDNSVQDLDHHLADVDQLAEDLGHDAEDLAEASIRGYLREDDSLSRIRILSKRTGDNEAAIVEEQTVRADETTALAEDITALQAEVDDNEAVIVDMQTTLIDGEETLAQALQQVKTTSEDNEATVETHAQSIDGLQAQYTVKVDTGNRVVGFGLASDGTDDTSNGDEFIVRSNNFYVMDPDTDELQIGWDSEQEAFIVDGDVVADGTLVANKLDIAKIDQITGDLGVMTAGTFKTTSSSTGRRVEVSDSGSYPFWYGSGEKTADNATMYLDADGNAMYRGGLDVESSSSDGSVEIKDNVIKVFDENGALRVQIGDLNA